jgi:hypothetical protein
MVKYFFILFIPFFAFGDSNSIYYSTPDKATITVAGYLNDIKSPYVKLNRNGTNYISYSFKLLSSKSRQHGDEYVLVSLTNQGVTGEIVTPWPSNAQNGAYCTLTGKFSKFKGNKPKGGLLGSINIEKGSSFSCINK